MSESKTLNAILSNLDKREMPKIVNPLDEIHQLVSKSETIPLSDLLSVARMKTGFAIGLKEVMDENERLKTQSFNDDTLKESMDMIAELEKQIEESEKTISDLRLKLDESKSGDVDLSHYVSIDVFDKLKADNDRLEDECNQLKESLSSKNDELSELQSVNNNELVSENESLKRELDDLKSRFEELSNSNKESVDVEVNDQLNAELEKLRAENSDLKEELKLKKSEFDKVDGDYQRLLKDCNELLGSVLTPQYKSLMDSISQVIIKIDEVAREKLNTEAKYTSEYFAKGKASQIALLYYSRVILNEEINDFYKHKYELDENGKYLQITLSTKRASRYKFIQSLFDFVIKGTLDNDFIDIFNLFANRYGFETIDVMNDTLINGVNKDSEVIIDQVDQANQINQTNAVSDLNIDDIKRYLGNEVYNAVDEKLGALLVGSNFINNIENIMYMLAYNIYSTKRLSIDQVFSYFRSQNVRRKIMQESDLMLTRFTGLLEEFRGDFEMQKKSKAEGSNSSGGGAIKDRTDVPGDVLYDDELDEIIDGDNTFIYDIWEEDVDYDFEKNLEGYNSSNYN